MALEDEIALLREIEALNNDVVREIGAFLCDAELRELTRVYEACLEKRNVDIGFNLFAIISDFYYRENLHSDVLRALLDPQGKHQEEEKYFRLFLEYLRSQGCKIHLPDYASATVTREEGKVDLLITDEGSRKAIIIENKINNAGDMLRQIPRYLEYVKARGYQCDAIIYLRLNGYADPDTTDWTIDERKKVKALLKVVCAYDETENDLLTGWLRRCERVSINPDAQHILRQYGALITRLGGNVMNKPIMEQFYSRMLEGENFKTALSVAAMLDDLIAYRRDKIIDTFKSDAAPFDKVGPWQNSAILMNPFWGKPDLGIDIMVHADSYTFLFWDRKDSECKDRQAERLLQEMNCFNEYVFANCGFTRTFAFPSGEGALYQHIRDFKKKLIDVMAAPSAK